MDVEIEPGPGIVAATEDSTDVGPSVSEVSVPGPDEQDVRGEARSQCRGVHGQRGNIAQQQRRLEPSPEAQEVATEVARRSTRPRKPRGGADSASV